MGIPQSILERVAMPSSRGSSRHRDQTHVSYISLLHWQAGFFPLAPPQKRSSPVEFNLPIQKSIPFHLLPKSCAKLNINNTLILQKVINNDYVVTQWNWEKYIVLEKLICYRGNKKLNLRSQWLQFITVKRIQMIAKEDGIMWKTPRGAMLAGSSCPLA